MPFAPAAMVANAQRDVGYREGNNNWNKFTPWQTYGRINHQPYCASAVSKWAFDAGFRFDGSCTWGARGDWNVGSQHQWALRRGLWRSASTRARPGWLVVVQFTMRDQHVGMVYRDNGGSNVATIEGNTSPGGVFYKTRVRGPSYHPQGAIAGFIALDEAGQTGSPPAAPAQPKPEPVRRPLLTTVAFPHEGPGRRPTARPVPELNTVLLENGARVVGDKPSGKNHIWSHPKVSPGAKLRDIAAVRLDYSRPLKGQVVLTAVYDAGNHDVLTYDATLP